MSFEGHIQNGVVVFDEPVTVPEGTAVRVEVIAPPRKTLAERFKNIIGVGVDLPEDLAKNHGNHQHGGDSGCFEDLAPIRPLDVSAKDSLRALLTQEQYEALLAVVAQGGPDVDAIRRLRAASMT
jgi:hypothetical protein